MDFQKAAVGDIDRREMLVLLGTAAIGVVGAACGSSSTGTHPGVTHWGYEGDAGPSKWGMLDSSFRTCATGRDQTPVDIRSADVTGQSDAVLLHTEPVHGVAVNNGHSLQVNVTPGCFATIDGTRYALLQFHYHTPSEHTFSGQPWVAEWHLVYSGPQSNLAVIGLMVAPGAENAAFAPVLAAAPPNTDGYMRVERSIDVRAMLPADLRVVRYQGSVTTPPCTEGVRWMVLPAPVAMSADQLSVLERLHGPNARPVQPLNGRGLQAGQLAL